MSETVLTTGQDKNFFSKLSGGDFGLAKTYWLYGVVVGIIGTIVVTAMSKAGNFALLLYFGLVAYQVVVAIGIWNASNKYTGSKIWAVLAKIAVVLGIIQLASTIFMLLQAV